MNNKTWPTLYEKSSAGKVKEWTISVCGNCITTTHGYSDGKKQVKDKFITEGKNLGRSNATTPEQQAEFEADADWKKKQDKGYKLTLAELDDLVILPMLAHDYFKRGKDIVFPALGQRKYDGIRCLANPVTGQMLSRGGKEFNCLPTIKKAIMAMADQGGGVMETAWFDGELYSHDLTLQQIAHVVKQTKTPDSYENKMEMRIYDCFNTKHMEASYLARYTSLKELRFTKPLSLVDSVTIKHADELQKVHDKFVEEGYEGLMIRNLEGGYVLKDKSVNLQKYKMFEDAEYPITGFKQDVEGCIIWVCKIPDGKEFDVVPLGTKDDRRELVKTGAEYIGKQLTVKFKGKSDDGIPMIAKGKGIRDYE